MYMRGSGLFKPKVLDIPGILAKSSVSDLSPRARQAEKLGFFLDFTSVLLNENHSHEHRYLGSSVSWLFVNF